MQPEDRSGIFLRNPYSHTPHDTVLQFSHAFDADCKSEAKRQ